MCLFVGVVFGDFCGFCCGVGYFFVDWFDGCWSGDGVVELVLGVFWCGGFGVVGVVDGYFGFLWVGVWRGCGDVLVVWLIWVVGFCCCCCVCVEFGW